MDNKQRLNVKLDSYLSLDLVFVVLFAIFMFWQQSGWYRVDCAVGVQAACDLIAKEYGAEKAQQGRAS